MNRTYLSSSLPPIVVLPDRVSSYRRLLNWLGRATSAVIAAVRRHHNRRVAIQQLAKLSDYALYDIGLSRSQIREVVDGMRTPEQLEAEHKAAKNKQR